MTNDDQKKSKNEQQWLDDLEEKERQEQARKSKPPHKISGKSVFELKKRIEERGREFR